MDGSTLEVLLTTRTLFSSLYGPLGYLPVFTLCYCSSVVLKSYLSCQHRLSFQSCQRYSLVCALSDRPFLVGHSLPRIFLGHICSRWSHFCAPYYRLITLWQSNPSVPGHVFVSSHVGSFPWPTFPWRRSGVHSVFPSFCLVCAGVVNNCFSGCSSSMVMSFAVLWFCMIWLWVCSKNAELFLEHAVDISIVS